MKKSILLIIILALLGCGPAFKYGDIRDHQEPVVRQDESPLIESIAYWRKADCLRHCAELDKRCHNDCCD